MPYDLGLVLKKTNYPQNLKIQITIHKPKKHIICTYVKIVLFSKIKII